MTTTLKEVKINFNLRSTTPLNKPTPINCVLRYDNNRLVISNICKVEPRYWNNDKQQARANQLNEKQEYINDILSSVKKDLSKVFTDFTRDNRRYPEPEIYKALCMKVLNNESGPTKQASNLIEFIELAISETESGKRLNKGKPYSAAIIKAYKTTKKTLIEFKEANRLSLNFSSIEQDPYEDFTDFLMFQKKFTTNTVGKHIKTVKTFINEAEDRGYNVTNLFKSKRFKVISEDTDTVYLNESELQKLNELDLSKDSRLERVRDLFLVGCYSGLRFSDYSDISPKSIKGDFLKIKAIKTGKEVVIPIHNTVREVMSKYEGKTHNSLPPSISNAKMNEYIKDVAEQAGIKEIVEIKFTKAGKQIIKNIPKFKLITTHTARRCFATNMYLMGVPTITIMSITGHKTERSFMRYIRVTPEEHATNMLSIWRRGNLKAV